MSVHMDYSLGRPFFSQLYLRVGCFHHHEDVLVVIQLLQNRDRSREQKTPDLINYRLNPTQHMVTVSKHQRAKQHSRGNQVGFGEAYHPPTKNRPRHRSRVLNASQISPSPPSNSISLAAEIFCIHLRGQHGKAR